jgi:ankyrin repeat protein
VCTCVCTQVQLLVSKGASPVAFCQGNWVTPLTKAAEADNTPVLEWLLRFPGVREKVNHKRSGGTTALREACSRGSVEAVRALLGAGADFGLVTRAQRMHQLQYATDCDRVRACHVELEVSGRL